MALLRRLLVLLLPLSLFAQVDTALPVIQMDALAANDIDPAKRNEKPKITAASRQAQDPADIPFTAYVITADQIRERGYSSLVDVLKDLPGIKVSQPGSALHGETFLMRGLFGNYYVKILVDDLPFQPSATSGMPIGDQLPIAQAERIEVIYGPAASIYGADAMAGVINIVTKHADKPFFIDADVHAGLPGNYGFDATLGGKFARKNRVWNYMVYGGVKQFGNLPITGDVYEEWYNPSNYVLNSDTSFLSSPYYKGTLTQPTFSQLPASSQKIGFRFSTSRLSFGVDFGQRKLQSAIGSNPLYKTYHDPNTYFGEQITRAFISYKTTFSGWASQSNLQFLHYNILPGSSYLSVNNVVLGEGHFYNYAESADIYAEQFLSRNLGSRFNLLLGVTGQFSGNLPQLDLLTEPFDRGDYRIFSNVLPAEYIRYSELGYRPYNFFAVGGLAELSYSHQNTSVVAGVRADYREFYGTAFSPRLGVVQKMGNRSVFRATASTAYRPPSSYLINSGVIGVRLDSLNSVAGPFPNDSLSAERLYNIDAGWLFRISDKQSFDLSAFYHVNANLITKTSGLFTNQPDFISYYGFINDDASAAQLFGVQAVHQYAFRVVTINFNSTLSLAYMKGNETLPYNRGELSNYRMQPQYTAKWLLEARLNKGWYFMLRTQYFSSWITRSTILPAFEEILTADGYYTLDAGIRWAFAEGQELYLNITNLTNNSFYGIGASGGVGVLNNEFLFDDLGFNPQMLRWLKLGVRIRL